MSTATSLRPTSPSRASVAPVRRNTIRRPQLFAAWALIVPFLIVFAAMFLVPLGYAGYLSTFTSQLVGGEVFSGLANYSRALQDPSFWAGLGRVAMFLLCRSRSCS